MIPSEDRLSYIDAAKGFGILLVVLGHNFQGFPGLTSWIYTFHMPLFFVVTGYLDAHKQALGLPEKPLPVYIRSKASALLWPYVTFSLVNLAWLIVFYLVMGAAPEDPFPVILLKMVSTYGYRALWFLPAMFFATIIHRVFGKKAPGATLVLSVLIGSSASLLLAQMPEDLWLRYLIMYFGRISIGVSFIQLGTRFYGLLQRIPKYFCLLVAAMCFLITMLLCKDIPSVNMSFARMQNIPLYYLLGCAGSCGVILAARACPPPHGQKSVFVFEQKLIDHYGPAYGLSH